MKAVIRIICATALLVTSSSWAATVDNVELSYEQGYTVAKIYVDGVVRFTHQSEIAKDGKPYRIIVDVLAAGHNLGGKEFLEVPACAIKGIRSSQFAVKPEKICRIVFDMVGETVYRTEQQSDAVVLYISDGFSQPFTNWSSKSWVSSSSAPGHDEPVAAAQANVTSVTNAPATSATDANSTIASDRLVSLQSDSFSGTVAETVSTEENSTTNNDIQTESPTTPAPETVATPPNAGMSSVARLLAQSFAAHAAGGDKPESTKTADSSQKPKSTDFISDSLTPEPWAMQVDFAPVESSKVAEEPKSATTPDMIPTATEEVSDSQTAPAVPIVSAALESQNPGTAQPAAESTRVRERAARKKSAPMSSLGPDFDISMGDNQSPKSGSTVDESKDSKSITEAEPMTQAEPAMLADADAATIAEPSKPASAENKPTPSESRSTVAEPSKPAPKKMVSGESKSSLSSGDTMASEKPSPADVAPAMDTSTTQPSNVDDSKDKSTARFRRDPITSKKMRGTLVAEFPQRLVIQYKGKSGRDPFETLVDQEKQYNVPVEKRVPNVEGLILVGVIETGWGDNRALFEDRSGNGYIMQSGDKVQKGYVLRVEKDRVYFQLFEYGWSRTVSITIEDE